MTEAIKYAPGTPMWVDLASPDLEASRTFYRNLFGWEPQISPMEEAGGYTLFTLGGKMVAGLGPIFDPQQPPMWSVYLATEDVDATAKAVTAAGGRILAGPMDVMDQGRMAAFMDSTGAAFATWQPGKHTGAEMVNVPGTFVWNELYTRDLDESRKFYTSVFPLTSKESDTSEGGMVYVEWQAEGRSVGGAMDMTAMLPAEVPPHWLTYFAVEDVEAAAVRIQELGGTVTVPPQDIPIGKMAVVQDPQGAHFALFQGASS